MRNNRIDILKKKDTFNLILVLVYAGLTLYTLLHHEPWRDEAQAWLLARDLGPVELLHQLPMEGTPGLWHFLLMFLKFLNLIPQ